MVDAITQSSSEHCSGRNGYLLEGAVYLCCIAVAYVVFGGVFPSVRFESELIRIEVDSRHLRVDGIYRYRNSLPFPVVQGLACPTPSGDGLQPVEAIAVVRLPSKHGSPPVVLPVRRFRGTPYFQVTVPGRSTVELRVRYLQKHGGTAGRYLLTTTAEWRVPLDHARYELKLKSLRLVRSNYPLVADGDGSYHFDRRDFMPREDWVFEFVPEGGES